MLERVLGAASRLPRGLTERHLTIKMWDVMAIAARRRP
jgi:hypothetical protein